jgi:hypothetical protein
MSKNEIIGNEVLKENLKEDELKGYSTIKEFQDYFDKIAKYIFGNVAICAGGVLYHLAEIEFYYKNAKVNTDTFTRTYKRERKAGQLFWHYSGVDICFSTLDNQQCYGGILIRSMLKEVKEGNEVQYELMTGPMRCANELINQCIKSENGKLPFLTISSIKIENDIIATIRQGVETSKSGSTKADIENRWKNKFIENIPCFCYYIKRTRDEWNHMGKKYVSYTSMPLFYDKEGREGVCRLITKD